tara:strand:+ start:1204 stop:1434 length:231 start_codon:yes stop_codon:yes gene_type:complete
MTPVTYFVLYLITLPDIEASNHSMHRLVFSYKEDCIEMAQELRQLIDPIIGKPNCVAVENYEIEVRIPLKKPEGML